MRIVNFILFIGLNLSLTSSNLWASVTPINITTYEGVPFTGEFASGGRDVAYSSQFRTMQSSDSTAPVTYEYRLEMTNNGNSGIHVLFLGEDAVLKSYYQYLSDNELEIPAHQKWVVVVQSNFAPAFFYDELYIYNNSLIPGVPFNWTSKSAGGFTFLAPSSSDQFVLVKSQIE